MAKFRMIVANIYEIRDIGKQAGHSPLRTFGLPRRNASSGCLAGWSLFGLRRDGLRCRFRFLLLPHPALHLRGGVLALH